MRQPHKLFERPQGLQLRLDEMFLRAGFALGAGIVERVQAVLQFVVDVLRDRHHFLDDFLLEEKLAERRLQFLVEPVKRRAFPFAFGAARVAPDVEMSVHFRVQFPRARHEPPQGLQVRLAAVHFLVQHHAVETFARRIGQQFFRQRQMLLRREAQAINEHPGIRFRVFDAFGDFHLLLARQQSDRAHLPQIGPHRVVKRIGALLFLGLLRVRRFHAVHFGGLHHFNLQLAQFRKDKIQIRGGKNLFRQNVADIVERQLPLFFREPDQLLDFFRQLGMQGVGGGQGMGNAVGDRDGRGHLL